MNNIFSIKRFALLVRKQWFENYLLYAGTFIVLVAFDFFLLYQNNNWDTQYIKYHTYHLHPLQIDATYIISLITCASLFVLIYFRTINSRTKQMACYTQPTSTLEKVAAVFLFLGPVMLLVFGTALAVSVPVMHSVYDSFYQTKTALTLSDYDTETTIKLGTLIILTLQALVLLGLHTFKRYAIVKTAIAIIGIAIVFTYVMPELTFRFILPVEGFESSFYNHLSYQRNGNYGSLNFDSLLFLPNYLICACWLALYFKIKEKQL